MPVLILAALVAVCPSPEHQEQGDERKPAPPEKIAGV
jgi:hypothetical protein